MAGPLNISRLSREEFKDAPQWINRLLDWLNQLFEQLAFALNGNITFDQNIRAQMKAFSIVAGAAPEDNVTSFACTLKVQPSMLFKGKATLRGGNYVPIGAAVDIEWRYDAGTVFITSISGLTAGETYDFVILLI